MSIDNLTKCVECGRYTQENQPCKYCGANQPYISKEIPAEMTRVEAIRKINSALEENTSVDSDSKTEKIKSRKQSFDLKNIMKLILILFAIIYFEVVSLILLLVTNFNIVCVFVLLLIFSGAGIVSAKWANVNVVEKPIAYSYDVVNFSLMLATVCSFCLFIATIFIDWKFVIAYFVLVLILNKVLYKIAEFVFTLPLIGLIR